VKVALFGGAGGVGSSAVFNLLSTGDAYEIVVIDPRENMTVSHVMDYAQVLELAPGASVRSGSEADLLDADVIVATAGAPLTVNTSRMVYLEANAAILRSLAAALCAAGSPWKGVLLVVTNPVDPLVTMLQRDSCLERHRVFGYTLNDSLRLRTGIGEALGVEPGRVDAWVVGEHGDGAVPVFSRVKVDGEPAELSAEQRMHAVDFMGSWYEKHVALDSGRSSTWTSGLGTARMVQAIAADDGQLLPASVMLDGEYGIYGVSLSVPVRLGPGGVREIVEWELADDERAALSAASDSVHSAAAAASVDPAHDPA
jgi:malate dehydrogenase